MPIFLILVFFKFYLNIFAYSYSLNEIFSTFKNDAIYFDWHMLYLLIDLPIFILLIFYQQLFGIFYKKNSKKVVLSYSRAKWFSFFFFLFVLQQIIFYIDEPFTYKGDAFLFIFYADEPFARKYYALPLSERDIVSCYGLLVHNIYYKIKTGNEDKKINAIQYGKAIKIKSKEKKNLMFIQVESLQSFVVSNSISNIEITPHLNQLISQKGYLHPFCFAFHLGGHSADADVSVINSIHPFRQTSLISLKTYDFTNSFARLLLKENYEVKAFHNHLKKFFHREDAYKKMKFEHFYEYKEMGYKTTSFSSKEDLMYSYVLNKINNNKKPYYYQLITMSTHFPFKSASHSSSKKYHFVKDRLSRDYLQCITEMDESLSFFIDNALKIDPNLLIFVYGDHIGGNLKGLTKPSLYLDDNLLEFVPLIVFFG